VTALRPPTLTVAADGALLHVEGRPTAQPALMLHGLGYASWAAADLRQQLAPQVGLWSLDHRGTGRSARGVAPITIGRLADDAATVLDRIGAPVPVVGYSMGGYVAQVLALTRPKLVAALVLIATSAGGPSATPVPAATATAWVEAAELPPADYAARTMPLSFRPGWPQAHTDRYRGILESRLLHPTPQAVWQEQYLACERFLADGYGAGGLAMPVLILHGADDRVVPVENGRALHRRLPRGRYREVEGAGHLLHIEEPGLVAEEILQLLSTIHQPDTKE
jgi:3-oxoadipate enol-lactonase